MDLCTGFRLDFLVNTSMGMVMHGRVRLGGAITDVVIPMTKLNNTNHTMAVNALTGVGVTVFDTGDDKARNAAIVHVIREQIAEAHGNTMAIVEGTGWLSDRTFVAGMRIIPPGAETCSWVYKLQSINHSSFSEWYGRKGSEVGCRILLDIYKDHASIEGIWMLLAGLASAYYRLTGEGSLTLAMSGPTGVGKTALLKTINALWGKGMTAHIGAMSSNAAAAVIAASIQDLPLTLDEATLSDGDVLSSMVYGEYADKTRATSMGGIATHTSTHHGFILMTSNRSISAAVVQQRAPATRDAILRRIFEINIRKSSLDIAQAAKAMDTIGSNYGLIGPAFMEMLLSSMTVESLEADLKSRTRRWRDRISPVVGHDGMTKWAGLAACIEATADFLQQVGLLTLREDTMLALDEFMWNSILENVQFLSTRTDSINVAMDSLWMHVCRLYGGNRYNSKQLEGAQGPAWGTEGKIETLSGDWDVGTGTIHIRVGALDEFFKRVYAGHTTVEDFLDGMTKLGYTVNRVPHTFSGHVGATTCYEFKRVLN